MARAACRPRVGACSFGKARDHDMRRQEAAGERAKTARERKEEGKKEKEEEVRSCPRGSVGLVFGHSLTDKGQQEEERRKRTKGKGQQEEQRQQKTKKRGGADGKGKGAARRAKAAEDKEGGRAAAKAARRAAEAAGSRPMAQVPENCCHRKHVLSAIIALMTLVVGVMASRLRSQRSSTRSSTCRSRSSARCR